MIVRADCKLQDGTTDFAVTGHASTFVDAMEHATKLILHELDYSCRADEWESVSITINRGATS